MDSIALRDRVLETPELRDMVFRAIACPKTFCRLRIVSKQFMALFHHAMDNIYSPAIFASTFFSDRLRAVELVRKTGALMAGSSVRQFIHNLAVGDGWLIIIVNEDYADRIIDFVQSEGYFCSETFTPFDPVHPRVCRRALVSYRYIREIGGKEQRVTILLSLHDPIRLLLSTTKPYAMQACDGWRFFDLYPKLGAVGPSPLVCNGRHAHLLTPSECISNLPANMFSLAGDSLVDPSVTFIERWIGDSQTWIAPVAPDTASYDNLVRHGWAVRLHAQRVCGAEYHHFWTDTVSRCLRHTLLDRSYAVPPPAHLYAKRVLDSMRNSLAAGAPELRGPHEGVLSVYDSELDHILDCYRVGFDYQYSASDEYTVLYLLQHSVVFKMQRLT